MVQMNLWMDRSGQLSSSITQFLRRGRAEVDRFSFAGVGLLGLGFILLVIGPHFKIDWLHDPGLAAFVAGLSLIISTASGKEAVRQQYAKEANLLRKTDVYGPLHAEFKVLIDELQGALEAKRPLIRRINITGANDAEPYYGGFQGPILQLWAGFRVTYVRDDFTHLTCRQLDLINETAQQFNNSMKQTFSSLRDILTPIIGDELKVIQQSQEFQDWQFRSQSVGFVTVPEDDWNRKSREFNQLFKSRSPLGPRCLHRLA